MMFQQRILLGRVNLIHCYGRTIWLHEVHHIVAKIGSGHITCQYDFLIPKVPWRIWINLSREFCYRNEVPWFSDQLRMNPDLCCHDTRPFHGGIDWHDPLLSLALVFGQTLGDEEGAGFQCHGWVVLSKTKQQKKEDFSWLVVGLLFCFTI